MKPFFGVLVLVFLISCTSKNNSTIVYHELDQASLVHYIVYIDSEMCSECLLKDYFTWQEPISFFNKFGNKAAISFIISPKISTQKTLAILIQHNLPQVKIYWDTLGVFLQKNRPVLQKKRTNTFLINKHGFILRHGSPVNNPILWEEYVNETIKYIQ